MQLESRKANRAGGPTKYRLHFIRKVTVPGKECWWQGPRENPLSDVGIWHIVVKRASTLCWGHVTGTTQLAPVWLPCRASSV